MGRSTFEKSPVSLQGALQLFTGGSKRRCWRSLWQKGDRLMKFYTSGLQVRALKAAPQGPSEPRFKRRCFWGCQASQRAAQEVRRSRRRVASERMKGLCRVKS